MEGRPSSPPHSEVVALRPEDQAVAATKQSKTPRNAEHGSPRLKTACSQCRQQKIKCRLEYETAASCERCLRMKLACLFEPRHGKGRPRSDSDANASAEAAKRRLIARPDSEEGANTTIIVRPIAETPSISVKQHANRSDSDRRPSVSTAISARPGTGLEAVRHTSTLPELPFQTPSKPTSVPTHASVKPVGDLLRKSASPAFNTTNVYPLSRHVGPRPPAFTQHRSINGLLFDAETIDNLFGHFFKFYHPFLPVLDPALHPNGYYTQSSFLFWSIIAVASRRWPKYSGLTASLRKHVLSHVTTVLQSPVTGPSSVIALLLLANWSLPETELIEGMPFVMSSAILHVATRAGLHAGEDAREFSRLNINNSESERKRKYQIFTCCRILYEWSSCCLGISTVEMRFNLRKCSNLESTVLVTPLSMEARITKLLYEANHELEQRIEDFSHTPALDGLIAQRSHDLKRIPLSLSEKMTALDRLHLCIAQLMLHALHFMKAPAAKSMSSWRTPFDDACELIHQLHEFEKEIPLDLHGPSYIGHVLLLASCTLFRCLKTPFADNIGRDRSTGQALLFSAIHMLRNLAFSETDSPARAANALERLWRSDTIFKYKDGSWDLELLVKSKFNSSVIYDLMAWSRLESADLVNGKSATTVAARGKKLTAQNNDGFEPDSSADLAFTHDWA